MKCGGRCWSSSICSELQGHDPFGPTAPFDHFRKNTATGNGSAPDPSYAFLAADIINLPGANNLPAPVGDCWEKNTFTSQFPSSPPLPACP